MPISEKVALLGDWSRRLLADERVAHVDASLLQVKENKFYADAAGTVTTQQRVRVRRCSTPSASTTGGFDTMRTHRSPGRTRLGVPHRAGLGLGRRAGRASRSSWPRSSRRPSVEAGVYDLVIDPSTSG